MSYVYILRSLKNGRFYTGPTKDLERRLEEHNSGKTKSIRNLRPLEVVFSQEFKTLKEARKIEYKLKQFKSRSILERIIEERVIRLGP